MVVTTARMLARAWNPMLMTNLCVVYGGRGGRQAKKHGVLAEGPALHLTASVSSGIAASLLCAPFDLVKSRVMATPELYKSSLDCVQRVVQHEGIRGYGNFDIIFGVFFNACLGPAPPPCGPCDPGAP